jgi:hypothetical protein
MFWGIISIVSIAVSSLLSGAAHQSAPGSAMRGQQRPGSQMVTESASLGNAGLAGSAAANVGNHTHQRATGANSGRRGGSGMTNIGISRLGPDSASAPNARFVIQPVPAGSSRSLYWFDTSVGSAAPPDTLGGHAMTPFGPDPQPGGYYMVTSVADPCPTAGSIDFSLPLAHTTIGDGWLSWSHGYTGDVYYTDGAMSVTITLPPLVPAFYFYVEPNPFSVQTFTVTADDGSSASFTADGSAGAAYCGVYGSGIQNITIFCTSGDDFAIGEFGICCFDVLTRACCYEDAAPAYCVEDVFLMDCIDAGGRWDLDAVLCADLDPPCGEYYGACCYGDIADPGYEPYQCIGDYLFLECMYLSEYTNWTGGKVARIRSSSAPTPLSPAIRPEAAMSTSRASRSTISITAADATSTRTIPTSTLW